MSMPSGSNRPKLDRAESRRLRELGARCDITNTAELVKAYNEATDPLDQTLLLGCLDQYVRWFSRQTEEGLTPNVIQSYSQLARIRCRDPNDNDVMRRFFRSLTTRLNKSDYCTHIMAALECTLHAIDPMTMKNNARDLLNLVRLLMSHLDEDQCPFTREMYVYHALTLFALHRTLVILQTVSPGQLPEKVLDDLISTMKAIEKSDAYYPYVYNARLIKSFIKNLKNRSILAQCVTLSRRLFHGLRGSLFMIQGLASIPHLEFDFSAVESGCKHFKEALGNLERDKWTPQLQDLMEAAEKSLECNDFKLYKKQMNASIDKGRCWRKEKAENNGKMLCFSIISQLRMMVVDGSSAEIRKEAMDELMEQAMSASSANTWLKKPHLFEAMLDALSSIQISRKEHSENADRAIESLLSMADDNKRREKVESWKRDIQTIESMISSNAEEEVAKVDELFDLMRVEMGLGVTWKEFQDNINSLKSNYQSSHFAEVPSIFNEWSSTHVEKFEYSLIRYEDEPNVVRKTDDEEEDHLLELAESKRRVRVDINLEDIVAPKKIQEGSFLSQKDRKYLLLGNPGTGKTSLTKTFVHEWALGKMGNRFEAVYLLRVRTLTNAMLAVCRGTKRDLATAIAQECFMQENYSDKDYEALWNQIDDDLEKTTTLMILDGVDEGDDVGSTLVRKALNCSCHLLLTSRPYNLAAIRSQIGVEMECLGLNDGQLERFLGREALIGAKDLLNQLHKTPYIWEMAHVPITASILCCIWNEKQEMSASEEAMPYNRLDLYDQMVNFAWERYVKKVGTSWILTSDRHKVVVALEKIAFHSRNIGEVLINHSLVKKHSPDGNAGGILRDAGFLLLQLEGSKYQFPHLSFQEYFAGCFLAKNLFDGRCLDMKNATDFISGMKYKEIHRDTLCFMIQKAPHDYGDEAIEKMWDVMDQQPRDVLGVHQTLLKLQMIETFLSIKEDPLDESKSYPICKEVADQASKVFGGLQCSEENLKWIEQRAKQSSNVLKSFPELFNLVVNQYLETGYSHVILFRNIMKLGHYCPSIWQPVEDYLWRRVQDIDSQEVLCEVLDNLMFDEHNVPEFFIEFIDGCCRYSSPDVRLAATDKIRCMVVYDDFNSDQTIHMTRLLELLVSLISDEEAEIRKKSIDCIDIIVSVKEILKRPLWNLIAGTSNQDEENVLDKACNDEDEEVRAAAMEAFILFAPVLGDRTAYLHRKLSVGIEDTDSSVRYQIGLHTATLAKSGEENANFAWKLLLQGLEDTDRNVRRIAVENIASVAHKANIDEASIMNLLLIRLEKDEDTAVRLKAMNQIPRIVTEPSEALIKALTQASVDREDFVQHAFYYLVTSVCKKIPSMVDFGLRLLETMCNDEDWLVRYTARKFFLEMSHPSDTQDTKSEHSTGSEELEGHEELEGQSKSDHFKRLSKKFIDFGCYSTLNKLEGMQDTVQDSDLLMVDAATSALEHSDAASSAPEHSDADFRYRGLVILKTVVNRLPKMKENTAHASKVVKLMAKAWTTDPEDDVKSYAGRIIQLLSLKLLFDCYWDSHDDAIVDAMALKLLDVAVTVTLSQEDGDAKLVIYEGSDEVHYRKSREEVWDVVRKMKSVVFDSIPQQTILSLPSVTSESEHKRKKSKKEHVDLGDQ